MITESGVYIERVSLLFPYLIHGIKVLTNSTLIAGIINGKVNWKALLYIRLTMKTLIGREHSIDSQYLV